MAKLSKRARLAKKQAAMSLRQENDAKHRQQRRVARNTLRAIEVDSEGYSHFVAAHQEERKERRAGLTSRCVEKSRTKRNPSSKGHFPSRTVTQQVWS